MRKGALSALYLGALAAAIAVLLWVLALSLSSPEIAATGSSASGKASHAPGSSAEFTLAPIRASQTALAVIPGSAEKKPPGESRRNPATETSRRREEEQEALLALRNLLETSTSLGLNPNGMVEGLSKLMQLCIADPSAGQAHRLLPDSVEYPLWGLPDGASGTFLIRGERQGLENFEVRVNLSFPAPVDVDGVPRESGTITLNLTVSRDWQMESFLLHTSLHVDFEECEVRGIHLESSLDYANGVGFWEENNGKTRNQILGGRENASPIPMKFPPFFGQVGMPRFLAGFGSKKREELG